MKYDKSLKQVWKWKEAIYNPIKKLSIRKQLDFIGEEAKKVVHNSSVRLRRIRGSMLKS